MVMVMVMVMVMMVMVIKRKDDKSELLRMKGDVSSTEGEVAADERVGKTF